jgi:hypothetical protein
LGLIFTYLFLVHYRKNLVARKERKVTTHTNALILLILEKLPGFLATFGGAVFFGLPFPEKFNFL